MNVDEALKTRVSVRAFRPDPLPEAMVREIVDVARYAPSGGNLQPWRIIAVAGEARDAVVALAEANLPGDDGAYPVYPANLWEPYRSRRYKVGEDMYALLGISRENKPARLTHLAQNFRFFGAPVGLFFVTDTRLGHAQWAHLGMFMQSIALAAHERGVQTCMQEAWARMRQPLHAHFGLDETDLIYAGMALGYADLTKPVNTLRSDRAPLDEIAVFKGF
jgi:nitroreductase